MQDVGVTAHGVAERGRVMKSRGAVVSDLDIEGKESLTRPAAKRLMTIASLSWPGRCGVGVLRSALPRTTAGRLPP